MRINGGKQRSSAKSKHPLAVALRKRGMSIRFFAYASGVQAATICRVFTGREGGFTEAQAERIWTQLRRWGWDDLMFL